MENLLKDSFDFLLCVKSSVLDIPKAFTKRFH